MKIDPDGKNQSKQQKKTDKFFVSHMPSTPLFDSGVRHRIHNTALLYYENDDAR